MNKSLYEIPQYPFLQKIRLVLKKNIDKRTAIKEQKTIDSAKINCFQIKFYATNHHTHSL